MPLRLRLALADVAALLHQTLPDVLFSGSEDGVEVEVRRLSAPEISRWDAHCTAVEALIGVLVKLPEQSVPGLLSLIPGVRSDVFELKLRVRLLTDFQTLPGWNLRTRTTATYHWVQKPTIGISIFDVDVSRVAAQAIDKHLSEACTLIDSYLQQELGLPQIVQAAWAALEPVLTTDENLPVKLLLRPDGTLTGTPVALAEDAFEMALEVQGAVEVGIGQVPEQQALAPLQPLKLLTKPSKPIDWHVHAGLAQVAAIAREQEQPVYAQLLENQRLVRLLQWPMLGFVRRRISQRLQGLVPLVEHWLNTELAQIDIEPYLKIQIQIKNSSIKSIKLEKDSIFIKGTSEVFIQLAIKLK